MPPDLRGVMRNFATGVCIATTYVDRDRGRHHDAVTINSLSSISLDPPLIGICLRLGSPFLADLLATKRWAISILPIQQQEAARLLARDRAARAGAVAALLAAPGPHTSALVLNETSWLECLLRDSFDLGDHTLVVGEVVAGNDHEYGPPLIFVHGGYSRLADHASDHHVDHERLDEWW